jgi:hypothetical protein
MFLACPAARLTLLTCAAGVYICDGVCAVVCDCRQFLWPEVVLFCMLSHLVLF